MPPFVMAEAVNNGEYGIKNTANSNTSVEQEGLSLTPTAPLTTRPARAQDAAQLAALFELVYGESSHPFQRVDYVQQFMTDDRNIYFVEVRDGTVIAGMGITCHGWHDAYEWGLGVTHPAHRRAGLAEALVRKAYALLCARRHGEMLFGYPRVQRIYDIGQTSMHPPLIATGHDGGLNVANSRREAHLIIFSRLPHARFTHITPPVTDITHASIVRETIWQPLGMQANPDAYPLLSFVGPQATEAHHHKDAPWSYAFDPTCCSGAFEITGYHGEQSKPRQMSRDLEALLQAVPAAQHISANVLADKTHLIRAMRELDFAMTAYLPAWYKCGNARYDCVRMVKRRFTEEPIAHGFETMIASFQAKFAQLFSNRSGQEVGA